MIKKERYDLLEDSLNKVIKKLEAEAERMGEKIPYIPVDDRYKDTEISWWTNGFWAGMMWQLYQATSKEIFSSQAKSVESKLDSVLRNYEKVDHDAGFIWLHTAVANYRITGDPEARQKGIHAASLLASRYQLNGKYILAWNKPQPPCFIIDSLMNMPLLYWATEVTSNPSFAQIAIEHTETVCENLIRSDGSCGHIAVVDEISGKVVDLPGGQGYATGSSWSRGQAWGLYGMALAYRYTGKRVYLVNSKKIANYFIAASASHGYVSPIDFRAPENPLLLDTTATVIAGCGLMELADHLAIEERNMYQEAAYMMVERVLSDYVDLDGEKDGILTHGSAKYHREIDREVKIIYGDYFLLELLLRFLDKNSFLW